MRQILTVFYAILNAINSAFPTSIFFFMFLILNCVFIMLQDEACIQSVPKARVAETLRVKPLSVQMSVLVSSSPRACFVNP